MPPEALAETQAERSTGGKFTRVLLLLFVGSGASALIYEIVWFHLLGLVIGASSISLAVLLGSFMGGMCLGSLGFHRFVSTDRHPLHVYAFLELGVGLMGLVILLVLPLVGRFYLTSVGYGLESVLLRALVAGICLLPPTILMGATLPAIARWIRMTNVGVSRLGFFYGANIVGAVIGTALAGFYLLRVFDTAIATYVAVTINIAVGSVAIYLGTCYSMPETEGEEDSPDAAIDAPAAPYVTIMLSGLTALGAEVVWTRQLSLLFGASVYNFSLILVIFLSGLGIGSSAGAVLARAKRPGELLGLCQLMLVPSILWGSFMITEQIPYWLSTPEFLPWVMESVAYTFGWDMVRCAVALLPATVLWGASFPLALAATARRDDPGKVVGGVYAANTVGAIVGSLFTTLIWIPMAGTRSAQQALMVLAVGAGVLMLVPPATDIKPEGATSKPWRRIVTATVGFVVAVLLINMMPATPQGLIAYGRFIDYWGEGTVYLHTVEGVDASVAVTQFEGERSMHVAGKVVASNVPIDMRLQRMLGHLPAMIHEQPRSILIVGCGAGVTAGSFVAHPDVERIVICEIEKHVPETAAAFFADENYDVLNDPRTELIIEDARHFLATTDEKFDIITSDPIHPWVRGAATMYSAEYFDLVKEHLNPGGVVTQWIPLYESSEAAVKSQLATFVGAFPDATVWNSDIYGGGYDVIALGQVGPTQIDVDALDARLRGNPSLGQSLADVDLNSVVDLLASYANQGRDMTTWLADAELNLDRNLRLQYLAGLALNQYVELDIYQALTDGRRYPENLFLTVNPSLESALRREILVRSSPTP